MPDQYTRTIADGGSFRDFALACAQRFLEGEALGTTAYWERVLRADEEEIARLEGAAAAPPDPDDAMARRAEIVREKAAQRPLYDAALAAARAWVPPAPGYERLREFMVRRLRQSVHDDVRAAHLYAADAAGPAPDPAGLHRERLAAAAGRAAATRTRLAEAGERLAAEAAWLEALDASFPPEPAAGD